MEVNLPLCSNRKSSLIENISFVKFTNIQTKLSKANFIFRTTSKYHFKGPVSKNCYYAPFTRT